MASEASATAGDTHQQIGRANVDLEQELAEAHRREAATAEVLKAISRSTFNLQDVLDSLIKSAAQLTDAETGLISRPDGEVYRVAAMYNAVSPEVIETLKQNPIPSGRQSASGRAVLERRVVHIHDVFDDPEYTYVGTRNAGVRTILAVPMLRENFVVGAIVCARREVRPFTAKQIELVQTFADQAVIAIENTRLFEAEQASKQELQESLEYQTAIGEVLNVISRSPTELQPVLAAIAATAARLCGSVDAVVYRIQNGRLTAVAKHGPLPRAHPSMLDLPLTRGTVTGRAVVDRKTIHVHDLAALADSEYPDAKAVQRAVGHRTVLVAPLTSRDVSVGAIVLRRMQVDPFSDKQIALLQTFADQAVIAIENTRLFEEEQASRCELQESLEYQTAISDVLGVISRSPSNLQPVLDSIVETAARLCQADFADFRLLRDGFYHIAASTGGVALQVRTLRDKPIAPGRNSVAGRAALERRTIHVPDIEVDPELTYHKPNVPTLRTSLGVPLMRDGIAVGVIVLFNRTVAPFAQKQISLVTTFADQALIAIENARLFAEVQARTRELTESLEQQTATADVLKVISRSALDVQKVLDALVESAARLCNAYDAAILQVFGDGLRLVAHHGRLATAGPVGQLTFPLVRGLVGGRAIIDRRTIQVADMLAEADEYPVSWNSALQTGCRTSLAVPLVHAGEAIGVILIRRAEVRPFTERQIELVNTFADQAVVAIENTRLFEEVQARTRDLQEALEQQTATSEVLSVISSSPGELQPVFETMLENAMRICEARFGHLLLYDGECFHACSSEGRTASLSCAVGAWTDTTDPEQWSWSNCAHQAGGSHSGHYS